MHAAYHKVEKLQVAQQVLQGRASKLMHLPANLPTWQGRVTGKAAEEVPGIAVLSKKLLYLQHCLVPHSSHSAAVDDFDTWPAQDFTG
jgi:hypothetical protein